MHRTGGKSFIESGSLAFSWIADKNTSPSVDERHTGIHLDKAGLVLKDEWNVKIIMSKGTVREQCTDKKSYLIYLDKTRNKNTLSVFILFILCNKCNLFSAKMMYTFLYYKKNYNQPPLIAPHFHHKCTHPVGRPLPNPLHQREYNRTLFSEKISFVGWTFSLFRE